jgi:ribosomal protein S18 acetylase RimI-like enzyme
MTAVELRPMREDEFEDWLPRVRDGYADGMVEHGGMSESAARAKAAADTRMLFPDGKLVPEQAVYVLEDGGARVGVLWVAEREIDGTPALWIYEIQVDEALRGRGYGRSAMLLAEEEARRRGIDRVALNVFGGNEIARNLYRSLGYAEQAVTMSKPVA